MRENIEAIMVTKYILWPASDVHPSFRQLSEFQSIFLKDCLLIVQTFIASNGVGKYKLSNEVEESILHVFHALGDDDVTWCNFVMLERMCDSFNMFHSFCACLMLLSLKSSWTQEPAGREKWTRTR